MAGAGGGQGGSSVAPNSCSEATTPSSELLGGRLGKEARRRGSGVSGNVQSWW